MAVVSRNRLVNDLTVEIQSEWIVARITEVGASQSGSGSCVGYPHAWVEQELCENGYDYQDDTINGLSGTTTALQAYAIDGSQATVGDIVLLRPRVMDVNGNQLYEFIKSGGTPNNLDCPHVTSVQCTGGMLVVTYDTTCVGV
jgi:hypothetical protein